LLSQQDGPLLFVGIDWAMAEHAVCVLDQTGRKVAAFTIEHTAAGFARLAARLGKLGGTERMPVAIERPDGRLVDAWWTPCWKQATRCCPSSPTRSRPGVSPKSSPARSPTPATPM
jgi:hypothetical protein